MPDFQRQISLADNLIFCSLITLGAIRQMFYSLRESCQMAGRNDSAGEW